MCTHTTGRRASYNNSIIALCAAGVLLAGSGCASLDARDELAVAADASRRVTDTINPADVWKRPVQGESPAWDGSEPLEYDDAVAVTLQSNPTLRRTLAVIRQRRAEWVQVGLPPNPTVMFGVGAAIDGLAGAPAVVQGMQMLSWLWKNPHRVDAAEADLKAAVYMAAETCVDLMATTRTQVAAVIAGQQLVAFDQQYAGITEHTVQLVRQHVDAGELPPLELDRVHIDHERARAALVEAEHNLLQAKLALLQTMGRPDASTAWSAVGHLPPDWRIPDDEFTLLELASAGRLDVAAAGQKVLTAAANLGLADTRRYPEVAAMVTWQRNFGEREAIVPGAQITLPILDNGDPAIAMNTAKLEAARLDLLTAQEMAMAEVRIDLSKLRNARTQVSILRNDQLTSAVRAFTRSEAAWKAGEVNLNTLLDTQRRRIQVERDLVRQSFKVMQAMCSLRKSVGGSFDAILDRVPDIDVRRDPATPVLEESAS